MESSQYFIAKSDKYVLVRKIGNRFFRIISDTNITPVELIYQKICSEGYTSEQELFQDKTAGQCRKQALSFRQWIMHS